MNKITEVMRVTLTREELIEQLRTRTIVVAVFRMRRGSMVRVPTAWIGCVTSHQTINARQSKMPRRGRPRPKTRMKVHSEDDQDLYLRRGGKEWFR